MKVWDFRFFLFEMCPFSINLRLLAPSFLQKQNVFASRMEKYCKIIKRAGSNKGEQGGKKW